MPDWSDPTSDPKGIIRRNLWGDGVVNNIKVINDMLGHPDGGHRSLTDGGILLGNGTGAIQTMAVLAKGSMVIGDGSTDPGVLTVGSDDQLILADSAQSFGLSWVDINWDVAEALMYG